MFPRRRGCASARKKKKEANTDYGSDLITEQRVDGDLRDVGRGGQDETGRYYFHSSVDFAAQLEETSGSAGSGTLLRPQRPQRRPATPVVSYAVSSRGGIIFLKGLSGSVSIRNSLLRRKPHRLSRLYQTWCAHPRKLSKIRDVARNSALQKLVWGFIPQVKNSESLKCFSSCQKTLILN